MNHVDQIVLDSFSERNKLHLAALQDSAKVYMDLLNEIPNCRERSIAITKIEEALMWGCKGVMENAAEHQEQKEAQ